MTNILWGTYGFQTLFYFSLILIITLEKEKIIRARWFGYCGCMLLMIYNPIMYFVFIFIFGTGSGFIPYYCRLFCLIPIVFVIAYAVVLILQKKSGWKKFCCTLLMLFIIAISGHSAYGESWFIKASNVNKVPADVIEICTFFPESASCIPIMVPTDLTVYMRQMDSRFSMPYGRNQNTDISNQLQSEAQNIELILDYAVETETDYIVSLYTEELLAQYVNWGCEVIGITDKYMVLKQHCPKHISMVAETNITWKNTR